MESPRLVYVPRFFSPLLAGSVVGRALHSEKVN
jgi:hypothetical protein